MGHYLPDLLSLGLYTGSVLDCVSILGLQSGDTGTLSFSRPVWGQAFSSPGNFLTKVLLNSGEVSAGQCFTIW